MRFGPIEPMYVDARVEVWLAVGSAKASVTPQHSRISPEFLSQRAVNSVTKVRNGEQLAT